MDELDPRAAEGETGPERDAVGGHVPTGAHRGPARWQVPDVDAAALDLARQADRAIAALRAGGRERWLTVLVPLVEPLEDGDLEALGAATRRVRAAFGVGESVAEDLSSEDALALREAADATLRAIARHEARSAHRDR